MGEFFIPITQEAPTLFGCNVVCIGSSTENGIESSIVSCYQHRSNYQIIFVNKGSGRIMIGDRYFPIESGNLILFRPHQYQRYDFFRSSELDLRWIYLESIPENFLDGILNIPDATLFSIKKSEIICNDFDIALAIAHEKSKHTSLLLSFYAGILLTHIADLTVLPIKPGEKFTPSTEFKIKMIASEIEKDFAMNVHIEEYASRIPMNTGYFIETFRQIIGETPLSYRISLRINRAKELLSSSNISVRNVALSVGYVDALYFSKIFKATVGMSPLAYRKSLSRTVRL